MAFLTRRGARSVTTDLDRVANLFQNRYDDLGVPQEYAKKFAYYCDVLSDRVERHAIKLAEEAEESEEEKGEKKEAGCEKLPEGGMRDNCESKKEDGGEKKEASKKARASKKAEEEKKDEPAKEEPAEKKEASSKKADDETGLSVDHGASGFDANVIADEVGGPLEIIQPPAEPWMNDFFTQGWFQELNALQESGAMSSAAARGAILTKAANISAARLRRLASSSRLSSMEDLLKVLHAKLSASSMAEVKALAPEVKKQIDAVGKVRDALIEQQALGVVGSEILSATDRIIQAVSEQVPYLQQVVSGVDGGSPVALLEFQKMLGGGSLKNLISLGASIVVDAAKGIGKAETKEAASVLAGEMPAFIKEKVEDKKDDKKDGKKDDKKEEKKEEKKEASEEEEESEEEEGSEKSASMDYDLFSN